MMREMLRVAERHKVQAITERFAMSKANDAVTKVRRTACVIAPCWRTREDGAHARLKTICGSSEWERRTAGPSASLGMTRVGWRFHEEVASGGKDRMSVCCLQPLCSVEIHFRQGSAVRPSV